MYSSLISHQGSLAMNTTTVRINSSTSSSNLCLNNLSPTANDNDNNTTENTEPIPPNKKRKQWKLVDFFRNYFEYLRALLITFLIKALRSSGPIPKHVAVIMDGNRRYAKKKGFKHVSEGHFEGAKALETLLEYAFRLGINTVTVYAFSIENFKRPAEEVDVLMSLASEKLQVLSQKSDLIKKNRVRINVLGALHLLPRHVQVSAAEAMLSTIHHDNYILNICFPYTSSHEISEACKRAIQYTRDTPDPLPIFDSPAMFDCFLDTWDSPPLEILVRTSGEARLSEFLMWQVCRRNTGQSGVQVHILDALWPEFGFNHLLSILIKYQSSSQKNSQNHPPPSSDDLESLKQWRRRDKMEYLNSLRVDCQ